MKRRLAIVASHVIQYQDPFFRLLAADPSLDVTVLYCSMKGARTYRDVDMGTTLRWDLEMLQGYRHQALRNLSTGHSEGGFWRLVNPGIIPALARGKYDAVLFMLGWGTFTSLLGMITGIVLGIPILLFGDSAYPPPERSLRSRVRAAFLRSLFRRASAFMISGVLNADYYRHYGADPHRFFLLPWAVDNERFARAAAMSGEERAALRARFGIAEDVVVVVFSGKLIERKDPLTLLKAFEAMPHRERASLLFLGDGILREPLEAWARERRLKNVHFAGFVNQSELPKLYGMADVFVLPSLSDPRGTVVNEAMACGLPVIVSDGCGMIGDIARPDDNAFVFPARDVATLSSQLDRIVADDALRATMSNRSREIIADWDFARGVRGVTAAMESLGSGEQPR